MSDLQHERITALTAELRLGAMADLYGAIAQDAAKRKDASYADFLEQVLQGGAIVGGVAVGCDLSASINFASDNIANARLVIDRAHAQSEPTTLFCRRQNRGFIGDLAADVGFIVLARGLEVFTGCSNHRGECDAHRPRKARRNQAQNTLASSCCRAVSIARRSAVRI